MTTCRNCGTDLSIMVSIIAAEGMLFCSKDCCKKRIKGKFDDVAEEISPLDIGLVSEDNNPLTPGQPKIAEILCRRDGCTLEEATYMINSCIQQMEECNYDPVESEEIMADHLGLEPDYVFDMLM